eukprot:1377611-Pyramimonas_sp.AAC.1
MGCRYPAGGVETPARQLARPSLHPAKSSRTNGHLRGDGRNPALESATFHPPTLANNDGAAHLRSGAARERAFRGVGGHCRDEASR